MLHPYILEFHTYSVMKPACKIPNTQHFGRNWNFGKVYALFYPTKNVSEWILKKDILWRGLGSSCTCVSPCSHSVKRLCNRTACCPVVFGGGICLCWHWNCHHDLKTMWTEVWQNYKNDICAQRRLRSTWESAQSDQSLRLARSMGSQGPNPSSSAQRRLWSDWVDAQADLSLRWAHMSFCWFCHAAVHAVCFSINELYLQ